MCTKIGPRDYHEELKAINDLRDPQFKVEHTKLWLDNLPTAAKPMTDAHLQQADGKIQKLVLDQSKIQFQADSSLLGEGCQSAGKPSCGGGAMWKVDADGKGGPFETGESDWEWHCHKTHGPMLCFHEWTHEFVEANAHWGQIKTKYGFEMFWMIDTNWYTMWSLTRGSLGCSNPSVASLSSFPLFEILMVDRSLCGWTTANMEL